MTITTEQPEIATSLLRTRINEMLHSIRLDAEANKIAKELKYHRSEYFLELYDFSYGVSKYDKEMGMTSDSAFIAIEIISAKANYDKTIRRQEARYYRFHRVLNYFSPEEKQLFENAFFTQKTIDVSDLKLIIRKYLSEIEQFYPDDEEELSFEGEEGAMLLGITKEKRLRRMKHSKSVLKELS